MCNMAPRNALPSRVRLSRGDFWVPREKIAVVKGHIHWHNGVARLGIRALEVDDNKFKCDQSKNVINTSHRIGDPTTNEANMQWSMTKRLRWRCSSCLAWWVSTTRSLAQVWMLVCLLACDSERPDWYESHVVKVGGGLPTGDWSIEHSTSSGLLASSSTTSTSLSMWSPWATPRRSVTTTTATPKADPSSSSSVSNLSIRHPHLTQIRPQ